MTQTPSPRPAQDPFVVTIIETPAKQTTFKDVVVGSLGITGLLVMSALVLGVLFAGGRVLWQRWFPPEDQHLPPVSPTS